jgi:hypothetical protein
MTTRTAQLAIALALTSSMVIAQSLAAPAYTQSGGAGCFKKGTRPHTVRQYVSESVNGTTISTPRRAIDCSFMRAKTQPMLFLTHPLCLTR